MFPEIRAPHTPEVETGHQAIVLQVKTNQQQQQNGPKQPHQYRHLLKEMAVAAILSSGAEYVASWLAAERDKHGWFFTARVPKHAIFGSLVYIPLNHWLLKVSRLLFHGRVDSASRFFGILFGLLVVAPVQKIFFFAAGALIAGARTLHQVRATIRAGLGPVMKVLLLAYPIAVAAASSFLPETAWSQFFRLVTWAVATYGHMHIKKRRLEALRKYWGKGRGGEEEAKDEANGAVEEQNTPDASSPLDDDLGTFRAAPAADATSDSDDVARSRRPSSSPHQTPPASSSSDTDSDAGETDREGSPTRILYRGLSSHRRRHASRDNYDSPRSENNSSDSDTGDDSSGVEDSSDDGHAQPLDSTDLPDASIWMFSKSSSSVTDSLDDGPGSEIDSDTSSELPPTPWWRMQ
ncbi:hypothetical protein BJY01DRAFT_190137 [Aspergillus pseudoustus]|uniref:Uncharacterized protein n=1 Tax=Aspergillus pseudoustus TaxID=1810923 RepID=A0ABR4JVV8_9EURO